MSFRDATATEIQHRIQVAWACLTGHKQELTSKRYPLKHRLRLYSGAVIPTMMHGAKAWAMSETLGQQLRRTQ
eukprot:4894454-Pyramimonas_sp.AAC.1